MSTTTLAAALFALRAVLGLVFVLHGAKHFMNRTETIAWTESIGFRRPQIQWLFMTFAELAIGVGLIAGLLTTFAAAGLVSMMAVAFWTVHRHAGFFVSARPDEGYEYVLTLAVAAVVVATLGPGEWSVDHALDIAATFDEGIGAVIALAGIGAAAGQLAAFYRPSPSSGRDLPETWQNG
jgi:putative oxidoreductase